jgi:hypothetical protein
MKVGEKTPTQLGPLERANLNHWSCCYVIYVYGVYCTKLLTFSPIPPPNHPLFGDHPYEISLYGQNGRWSSYLEKCHNTIPVVTKTEDDHKFLSQDNRCPAENRSGHLLNKSQDRKFTFLYINSS